MEVKKHNHYIENTSGNNIDKLLFQNNPNIRFKENIVNDFNSLYWVCDTFDVYYPLSENEKELYLVYSLFEKKQINILRLSDKKIIKTLAGHSDFIDNVKNFYNDKDNHNYLLSSDWNKTIFIWDLDNNYELKNKIITEYTNYIYSSLIYFKLDYVITSTVGNTEEIDYIKIFNFQKGTFIRDIPNTDNNDTLYLLIWEKEEKEEKENYLIALCYEKVSIYNLKTDELYGNLSTNVTQSCGDYYLSGFISYDNKYLYTSSKEGYINIWNLNDKILFKTIFTPNSSFFAITPWSIYVNYSVDKDDLKLYKYVNNYILVCDKDKNSILIFNIIYRNEIDFNEIKNTIENLGEEEFYKSQIINISKNRDGFPVKMIKKIKHSIYGDSILCSDENQNIDLWVNNQPIIINDYI